MHFAYMQRSKLNSKKKNKVGKLTLQGTKIYLKFIN